MSVRDEFARVAAMRRSDDRFFVTPEDHVGSRVSFVGRVVRCRELSSALRFILIRARLGSIQCVVPGGGPTLRTGDLVSVEGELVSSNARTGLTGYEVQVFSISIVRRAAETGRRSSELGADLHTRMVNRHLDLRNERVAAIFRIRSALLHAARDSFLKMGFIEVNSPRILGRLAGGPLRTLDLDFFGKRASLSLASILLHGLYLAGDMWRVFEIGPVFYGVKSRNANNLAEFNVMEWSAAFFERADIIESTEVLIENLILRLNKECAEELEILGIELPRANRPFPCISLREVVELIRRSGFDLDRDSFRVMPAKAIKCLESEFSGFFWVLDHPAEKQYFFQKEVERPWGRVCLDAQLWYPRSPFRIAAGGERETELEAVERQIQVRGLDPDEFEPYLRGLADGAPPYSGIGMGVERVLELLLQQQNIRELVLYPRDPDFLFP